MGNNRLILCLWVILWSLPKSFPNACEESCSEPLGMGNKGIKDFQIIGNPDELQSTLIKVDLSTEKVITGLSTQGFGDSSAIDWVTSYTVMYESKTESILPVTTLDGKSKVFRGNKDSSTVRYHDFPIPIVTSVIYLDAKTSVENIGLELELYGCDPGYYFVVWRMFDGRYFTPNHANVTRSEYKDTKGEALEEIESYFRLFPGFFSVEFLTLRSAVLGYTVLAAEIKVFCLKSMEKNLVAKLNTEIKDRNMVFQFPVKCNCSYPHINISLNKTLDEATVLYTTQNLTIYAETKRGNCHKSVYFNWEIAKASDESSEFGSIVAHGDAFYNETGKLELKGRELDENYLYIRCTAFIKTLSGDNEVKAYDYGYIRVLYPPLVARITGDVTATKGNGSVTLDASSSYDPHTPGTDISGLTFTWYCQRLPDNVTEQTPSGCYGNRPGKLSSTGARIVVDVDRMEGNHTYLFEMVVTKDRRVSRAFHTLTVNPLYVITLRCTINCGQKVSTNKRMIIEATCTGPYCLNNISYSWTLYQFTFSTNSSSWLEVQDLQSYILTNMDSANIVFSGSRKPLKQDTKYKIVASVLLRDNIIEKGEQFFDTNSPPHNPRGVLGCNVYPKKGRVLQTKFKVTCLDWEDQDLPLSYQLSYCSPEGLVIIFSGNTSSFITMLPQGNQSKNYEVDLEVQIFDSLGDASTVKIIVQVEPLRKSEVTTVVNRAIYGPNSTTAELLRSGNLQKATLTSYFSLTATEGAELSTVERNSAKDEVLRQLALARPQMLQEVTQLSAVVNKATKRRKNMTVNTVSNATTLLKSMANHLDKEARISEEIDVIQQVGGGLLNGMSYVIEFLSRNEEADTKQTERLAKHKRPRKTNEEKPRMIEESVALIDKLGTALLSTRVVGESEPSVYKTDVLSLALDRQTPYMLVTKGLQLDNGTSGVTFPSREALMKNLTSPVESLDAQIITFKSNPFIWGNNSENLTSNVMDISMKSHGQYLHLAELEEPFGLYIPLKHRTKEETDGHYFVKSSKKFENIRYHKIIIPSDKAAVIVDIVPTGNHSLEVFISAGVRPTPENYSYSTYVPNYSHCNNVTTSKGHQPCSSISPYRLMLSSSLTGATGNHYVGILLHNNYNSSDELRMNDTSNKGVDHSRHSRSLCNTKSGRNKRSCIGVKDPPTTPPPTPKVIKPEYNPNDDVNYTMSVSISSCLYWSKEKQQWTNDGCRVGSKTDPSKLHCLCNHLSAFGGYFFVAANPIDFDKVWLEFERLGETGNLVTIVVFCIYGVYLAGLVLARRTDKKDRDKVVANVVLRGPYQGSCIYRVQIQTGIWKGFGTTANVRINIFGEEGNSGPIILTDSSLYKKVFSRGSVTNFVIFLPHSLGRLIKLCISHDNFGQSPSWFLQQVMITEVHTGSKWYFFANQWIALERGSGDLSIELNALDKKEKAGFKHLFSSMASKSLGDGHIWASLFTRPPHSQFTRCQRLSCCLSFLFSSMVVSAMFYQFSDVPVDSFKFGPLVVSWRQIIIGIQSSFVAIPVNFLIVTLFRNTKQNVETRYDSTSSYAVEKTPCFLPWWFVVVAWILCILVTLASSAFTVFYSLSWDPETSNRWFTSIIVSVFQDVVFFQPVKVIILAAILSLLRRGILGKEHVHGASVYIDKEQEYNAPNEYHLSKAKEYGTAFLQMCRTLKDVAALLIFFILLMLVCYGNRDSKRFLMTTSVKNMFRGFEKVTDKDSFWRWTSQTLIPGLYRVTWYNNEPFHYQEGFLSNRNAFSIGMPRLRQIRIKSEKKCQANSSNEIIMPIYERCLLPYTENNEDKHQYYQPKWIPITNHSNAWSSLDLSELCPKPWRYQSAQTLQSLPYQGLRGVYDGGGYVADLGYNGKLALDVISKLRDNEWINELTVAVFIEFSVHEPSSRLFSFVKFLYERLPNGGVVTTVDVQTRPLYPPLDGYFNILYELSQLFFVFSILILLVLEIKELVRQKKAYFVHFWNWVNVLQILTASSAAVVGVLKAKETSFYVRAVQTNPYENSSPDRLGRLSDYEDYLLSLVIFTVTVRLLNIFKFNSHICNMAATLRRSVKSLVSFTVVYGISLMAFSFTGALSFGLNITSFSSLYRSFETVVQMSVGGKVNFSELTLHNQTIGPLFLSVFVMWMSLILVNMSVAILVDFYKVEREDSSNDYLASFMYSYFTARAVKVLTYFPFHSKSKRTTEKYSKTYWKRTDRDITAVSETLPLARSSADIADQESESILPFHEFDSSENTVHCNTSDCICSDNSDHKLCPEICSTSEYVNERNGNRQVNLPHAKSLETIPFMSNAIFHSHDDGEGKTTVTSQAFLDFVLDLNEIDIDFVKSNINKVSLELNKMLTCLKGT